MDSESTGSRDASNSTSWATPRSCVGGCGRSPTSRSRSRSSRSCPGCLTLFGFAMNIGGPAVMTLGWLFVGFFVTLVALGMAEVASSYPTAGGLYYWAAKLAPEVGRNPARVELVRRLVQPHRPGRRHGRHRLRAGVLHTAFLNLAFGVSRSPRR